MKQIWFNTLALSALVTGALLQGCGPQTFVPSSVDSGLLSPGSMNIPPKIDIVLGMSLSGTMRNLMPAIQTQIPAFALSLQKSGWDYRFVTVPLAETTPGSSFVLDHNVSVSNYSTNYVPFGTWIPPFPNASSTDPNLSLLSSLFANSFVFPTSISAPNDGHETGLLNITTFLNRNDVNTGKANTGFLRSDAVLAVIVLSADDDKSGGTWVCPTDTKTGNPLTTCASNLLTWKAPSPDNLSMFQSQLLHAKGGASSMVKYYSLTAPPTVYCTQLNSDGAVRYGYRYGSEFTAIMNGKFIDICANPLSTALSSVAADLTTQKLSFRQSYVVLGTEPNLSTVQIIKNNGDGTTTSLVKDDPNGWTYIGGPQTIYTIDQPVPMDQQTGYVIQLNGNGRVTGQQSLDIKYVNAGSTVSQ